MVGRGIASELTQSDIDSVQNCADVRMAYDIDKSAKEQENTTSHGEFLTLGRETQWSDGGKCYSHGPEWGIAHRITRGLLQAVRTEKRPRIYFIKFAMGSTSLHDDWNPSGPYFSEFMSFTKQMLQRVGELEVQDDAVSIDALFWNQGDSDASGRAEMRTAYEHNLVQFVRLVWDELAGSGGVFPFVPLQLHWKIDESSTSTKKYRKAMDQVNTSIQNACVELGPCAALATISEEFQAQWHSLCFEDGHSNSRGLFWEGKLLADVFLNILAGFD